MDPARLQKIFVQPDATIRDAIKCIDEGAIEIALAVDEAGQLVRLGVMLVIALRRLPR